MESMSRISNLLESARELTLDASSAARSFRSSPRPLDNRQIKKLLDSRIDREVLDGLRRVTSMMYSGQKTLPFFSAVVKNVASPNIEIKKLVYIYVVHHAEQEPDMALLSINTIQKSLSDANPQVRALALRTMSGIRVPVISQIVSLAIKKGTADMSPYVRRAAAMAIPKCYRLDPGQLPQLLEQLAVLLGDKLYYVAGAAVTAFLQVCPERLDLVHKHYRGLVKKIVDMDEWSQLSTLRLMTVYARKCFPRRTRLVPAAVETTATKTAARGARATMPSLDHFYDYADTEMGQPSPNTTTATEGSDAAMQLVVVLDPDLRTLLDGIRPLLQSRNSGVIVAVMRCYVNVGTAEYVRTAVGPLVALLRSSPDIQQVALFNIAAVCLAYAADFVPFATHFLVSASDPPAVWALKMEVLALLFPHSPRATKALILHELEHFARGTDKALVREAVRAMGRCAQADRGDAATAGRCLRLLLSQITSLDGTLAAESLTVIRHLIQQAPLEHAATVVRLAKNLDAATDPQARATIIWLVGEFSGLHGEDNIAADVLRILAKDFASESEAAKRQIVLLAAKVYLHHINRVADQREKKNQQDQKDQTAAGGSVDSVDKVDDNHPVVRLWDYVQLLARYDTSYDLRDRTRLYRALLEVPQLATLMLLAPKPVPHAPSPSELRKGFTLGSAALVIGGGVGLGGGGAGGGGGGGDGGSANGGVYGVLPGYQALPEWVEEGEQPDARLRDNKDVYEGGGRRREEPGNNSSSTVGQSGQGGGFPSDQPGAGATGGSKVGIQTLDDWLAEGEGNEQKRVVGVKGKVGSVPPVGVEESEEESGEEEEGEEEDEEDEEDEEEDEEEEEDDEEEDDEDEDDDEDDEDESSSDEGGKEQVPLVRGR